MNLSFYGLAFFGAFAAMQLITPLVRWGALKTGFMDVPKSEAHKQQSHPVALGGGIAAMIGGAAALAGGAALLALAPRLSVRINLSFIEPRVAWLAAAALGAGVLGLYDDIRAMKALPKFAGQFAVALIAVELGGARASLFLPQPWLVTAVSILWFMFIMNAVNFFDNMDGLASGAVAIAMVFFTLVSAFNGQLLVGGFTAACAGIAGGFWRFNRNPASIYLGDCGSHFLGFLTALASVFVTYFHRDGAGGMFQVAAPLLILGVIIIDAATVCVIRTAHGRPFWIGDNNHISHRFVALGMSRARAVNCVHLLSLVFGCGALALLWGNLWTTAAIMAQAAVLSGFVLYIQFGARK
ncbi:MAG: MraY family glycosyltransferase [Victivallaceae bacterium]|nr:MraY family glycosyltransferase [Victivallaceae bacterium]